MEPKVIRKAAQLAIKDVYSKCTEVGDLGFLTEQFEGVTIVAIRGTANIKNAGRDINVIPWYNSKAGFMSTWGFTRAFNKLFPHIIKELPKDGKIVFTGHSLGGAIATHFGEYLKQDVISFGSPRVYFRSFFKSTINHLRYVRDDDPIPMIPRVMFMHKCEPIVLKDRDNEFIDIKDHFGVAYMRLLDNAI